MGDGWRVSAGCRTVEEGADVGDVCASIWLDFVTLAVVTRWEGAHEG